MTIAPLEKWKKLPLRRHWLVFGLLCAAAYTLFAHPDVIETSNHAYVLLDSLFKGRFFHFYNDVMAQPFGKDLYYINFAHYNIAVYLIFAVAELPVFLFNLIFGTYHEPLLYFIGKLVSAGFFFACIPLVKNIAEALGLKNDTPHWAALFFALSPPVFFSCVVMGQYDSICLFFTLLGVWHYLRGNTIACAFWLGAGAGGKFFSLLLLVPLVLLAEKRPLHILKHGAVSLWLLLPTSLLFWGRTGDMGAFTNIMISRLFAAKLPAASDVSIFPLLYCCLCILAYLWQPRREDRGRIALWLCLAVFSALFLFVAWHPQWLVLLMPFLVLATFLEKKQEVWFFADMALSAGFFLFCFVTHPRQLEANMLDYGLLAALTDNRIGFLDPAPNPVLFYLNLLPVVSALPMVLFGGALLCHMVFKFPAPGGTPAARLAREGSNTPAKILPRYLWAVFCLPMAAWLLPTLFTWIKAFY